MEAGTEDVVDDSDVDGCVVDVDTAAGTEVVATEVVLITDVDVPEDASGDVDDGTGEEVATEVDVPEVDAVGVVVDPTVGAVAEGEVPDGEFVAADSIDDASDVVDG